MAPTAPLAHAAKQVLVCSNNRVKVDAVRRALAVCFPQAKVHVEGREAASGVPDQPHGDAETLAGARNRIAALKQSLNRAPPRARPYSLLVAIEGGVGNALDCTECGKLECFAWVVCEAASGAQSNARSASFHLPDCLTELIKGGMELGHADDKVFGRVDSKQQGGTVGQLTHGLIDRTTYYEHAVILALVPFLNGQLYGNGYEGLAGDLQQPRGPH